jgi:anti-sigma regulatory factor (Ser/Thr protein kinase)
MLGWLEPLALPEDAEDDLVLAVNEAASNCIEHAYRPATVGDTVDVRCWTEPHAVFVEIVDHGRWRTPTGEPTRRGRGIVMMQRLMASVEIHPSAGRGSCCARRSPAPPPALRSPAQDMSVSTPNPSMDFRKPKGSESTKRSGVKPASVITPHARRCCIARFPAS